MNPELRQNILYMIYFILMHNIWAIICTLGVLISIGVALLRPSRNVIIMMLGWMVLLFAYEYDKHIAESLRDQTINSLITITPRYRLQWSIDRILTKGVPLVLTLGGGIMVLYSGYRYLKIMVSIYIDRKSSSTDQHQKK